MIVIAQMLVKVPEKLQWYILLCCVDDTGLLVAYIQYTTLKTLVYTSYKRSDWKRMQTRDHDCTYVLYFTRCFVYFNVCSLMLIKSQSCQDLFQLGGIVTVSRRP